MALVVAIEGLPGSGKTTIIEMMVNELRKQGFLAEIVDIETIGHAPMLREIARTYPLGHLARMMIFWILRLQQYEAIQEIRDEADIVVADRFWGSTFAFDYYGNGVPWEILGWVGRHIEVEPDITILFEAPLEVVKQRKEAKTMQDPDFASRVECGYEELAAYFSWICVDATKEPEQVMEKCLEIILSRI